MVKISLIHPSRGRPEKAKSTYDYWMSQCAYPENIEHILSLDFSDPKNEDYEMNQDGKYKSFGLNSRSIIDHNDCVVEATNQAAKLSNGDVLIYLSDDFKCPKNWDKLIIDYLTIPQRQNIHPVLLRVNDGHSLYKDVVTIPIMNRILYEKLGYFWNPIYKSIPCDRDLYNVCEKYFSVVEAPSLLFQHEHYCNGMAEYDDTYKHSEKNIESGNLIFKQRQTAGFPL